MFQGEIIDLSTDHITINKCFHNGMRFKRQEAEIKISKDKIAQIEILQLPSANTPSPPIPTISSTSNSTHKDNSKYYIRNNWLEISESNL